MLARHRLVHELRIVQFVQGRVTRYVIWSGEVAVHADPLHHTTAAHLVLAYDRNVILALAGDNARGAADALRKVDYHAPLVLVLVVESVAVRVVVGPLRIVAAHPSLIQGDVRRNVGVHSFRRREFLVLL